jgi:hypothetical protein
MPTGASCFGMGWYLTMLLGLDLNSWDQVTLPSHSPKELGLWVHASMLWL